MKNTNYFVLGAILTSLMLSSTQVIAKESEHSDSDFNFDADYLLYGTRATTTKENEEAGAVGGVIRYMFDWTLTENEQKDKGKLIFKIDQRNSYTDTSPKDLIIKNVGAIGLIQPIFSDIGFRLTNLYWKQQFNQNETEIMVGFLDGTDYLDTYALGNPWNGFSNFIFSTGAGTLTLPDQASLGVTVRHMFDEHLYGIASLTDGNADSKKPFDGLGTVFKGEGLFSSLELGWVESLDEFYIRNIHLTAWQLDGGSLLSKQYSNGINLSANYMIDRFIPFLRAGYAEGDASLISSSVTAGVGYVGLGAGQDSLNFAVGWGKPNKALFGELSDDQYTVEVFYKYRVNSHLTISPNIQYLHTLPLNPKAEDSWVGGLRAYFTL